MAEHTESTQVLNQQSPDDEINLLEYLLVILKYKKMIFVTGLVSFVVACGITLLMPNIYTSEASILPSSGSNRKFGSMLSGEVGDLAAFVGISGSNSSSPLYVAMLNSRTITEAVINRLDLKNKYKWDSRTVAYASMIKKVQIEVGKRDGVITIMVSDKDPELAAKIANTYIEELQKFNVERSLSSAGKERVFLEGRLELVAADLTAAEDALTNFQENNKAIKLDTQANAIIDAIAKLKGQLASQEVELGVLLSSQTEKNPQVISVRESISQIKNQIERLARSPKGKVFSDDIFLKTSDVPALSVQYARLLREFKIQETLYELLTKQYEIAKINEEKNTEVVQILDAAVVSDMKSKPKRSIIVIKVTFLVLILSIIFSFFREYGFPLSKDRN